MFDYSKLNGRIIEKVNTRNELAIKAGISRTNLSLTMNNKRDFKRKEMLSIADVLEIPYDSIPLYFFNQKVQKSEQTE